MLPPREVAVRLLRQLRRLRRRWPQSVRQRRRRRGRGREEEGKRGGAADGAEDGGAAEAWSAVEEEQAVRRCCVLSKFLGLLLFSPQWDVPPLHAVHAQHGTPSFGAAALAAASCLTSQPPPASSAFDPHALVCAASRHGRLALCLPWLSGLLRMLVDDPLSRRLPTYTLALEAIATLAASPSLQPLLPAPGKAHAFGGEEDRVRAGMALVVQELMASLQLPHPVALVTTAEDSSSSSSAASPPVGSPVPTTMPPMQVRALAALFVDRRVMAHACPSLGDVRSLLKSLVRERPPLAQPGGRPVPWRGTHRGWSPPRRSLPLRLPLRRGLRLGVAALVGALAPNPRSSGLLLRLL